MMVLTCAQYSLLHNKLALSESFLCVIHSATQLLLIHMRLSQEPFSVGSAMTFILKGGGWGKIRACPHLTPPHPSSQNPYASSKQPSNCGPCTLSHKIKWANWKCNNTESQSEESSVTDLRTDGVSQLLFFSAFLSKTAAVRSASDLYSSPEPISTVPASLIFRGATSWVPQEKGREPGLTELRRSIGADTSPVNGPPSSTGTDVNISLEMAWNGLGPNMCKMNSYSPVVM